MTQMSSGSVIRVKPQPNIYTILLVVAILVVSVTLGLVLYKLMSPLPNGYGLEFGDIFKPWQKPV